jgi:hypothetical protein
MELPQQMQLPVYVFGAFVAVLTLANPPAAAASESATASITVSAAIESRTSLKVSSQVLQFDVAVPGQPGVATVDFSAGARTRSGGDVVMTVEPLRAVEGNAGPGGAADVETSITFAGTGDGTLAGTLQDANATVAGRWNGSGFRTGRLTFALRASAAGSYTVPVRFVLSTP